ncbi:MAG: hypothetical protein K0S65_833 [Labilithrix sp.]|nr:hypothetical protein [Labilithrix sp.]
MGTQARKQDGEHAQSIATIPAPPSSEPSERPTAMPRYNLEALAAASSWETGLPQPAQSHLPLDLVVPVRKRASVDGAPLRAAFLLSHVDDHMSIAEIALTAQLPVADVIECFVLLADLGVVELRGAASKPRTIEPEKKPPPPHTKSGLRPKS